MGCGGSKSTAVSSSNERAPLMKDDTDGKASPSDRRKSEDEPLPETNASGYSKVPQEDKDEAPVKETDASEPANMDIEENRPAEKTTTRYTKLPPMDEDKNTSTGKEANTETTKPEMITEEDEDKAEHPEHEE